MSARKGVGAGARAPHIASMKPALAIALAAALAASLAASPALPAGAGEPDREGGSRFGLPSLEELEGAAREAMRRLGAELAPLMAQLSELIDELDAYEAPRRLPNGDILIPRKRPPADEAPEKPAEPAEPPETLDL